MDYGQILERERPCSTSFGCADLPITGGLCNGYTLPCNPQVQCVRKWEETHNPWHRLTTPGYNAIVNAGMPALGRLHEGGTELSSRLETSKRLQSQSPHGQDSDSRPPCAHDHPGRAEGHIQVSTAPSEVTEGRAPVDVAVHHAPEAIGRRLGLAGDGRPCGAPELETRPVQTSVLFDVVVVQIVASRHVLSLAVSTP